MRNVIYASVLLNLPIPPLVDTVLHYVGLIQVWNLKFPLSVSEFTCNPESETKIQCRSTSDIWDLHFVVDLEEKTFVENIQASWKPPKLCGICPKCEPTGGRDLRDYYYFVRPPFIPSMQQYKFLSPTTMLFSRSHLFVLERENRADITVKSFSTQILSWDLNVPDLVIIRSLEDNANQAILCLHLFENNALSEELQAIELPKVEDISKWRVSFRRDFVCVLNDQLFACYRICLI